MSSAVDARPSVIRPGVLVLLALAVGSLLALLFPGLDFGHPKYLGPPGNLPIANRRAVGKGLAFRAASRHRVYQKEFLSVRCTRSLPSFQRLAKRRDPMSLSHADLSTLFWISVCWGLGLAALLALSAPLIAGFYGEPRLVPLVVASAVIVSIFQVHLTSCCQSTQLRSLYTDAFGTDARIAQLAAKKFAKIASIGYLSLVGTKRVM